MFVALLLQAFGSRIFPLVAAAVALAFEVVARDLGVLAQLTACTELFVVLAIYAAVVLGRRSACVLKAVANHVHKDEHVKREERAMTDTVAVTGAEGFIGSHLVEALVRRGHRVRAMVLYNMFSSCGWLDTLDPEIIDQVDVVFGDVRDPATRCASWSRAPRWSTTWPRSDRCRTPTARRGPSWTPT